MMIGHGFTFFAVEFDGTSSLYQFLGHDESPGMTVEKKSHKGISLWRVLSLNLTYPHPVMEAMTVLHLFQNNTCFFTGTRLSGLLARRFVAICS